MPNERKIKSTGDLREMLSETLVDVREGKIKPEDARMVHKLAHAINDSFFAETKMLQLQMEMNQHISTFGASPLAERAPATEF